MLAPILETEMIFFLLLAIIVAIIAMKVRFPYTIALVFVGVIVALSKTSIVPLSQEMIFFLFLPPLLFEGAVHIHLRDIRENILTISLLSVIGIIISVAIIGFGLSYFIGIPLLYALLFGAIISPTDPISVLALFKKLGVSKKLSTLVEGESLFNDGTGVVIFEIILGLILGHHLGVVEGVLEFFKVVLGGFLIGGILGYLSYSVMKHIDDHLVEVMITFVLAYGAFIIAEYLHVSGVIAVVAAGLLIGNYGTRFAMSPTTRMSIIGFWEVVVFIVNSVIFILIGASIPLKGFLDYGLITLIAILVVLVARAVSVYLISNLTDLFDEKTSWSWQHVINWGGLRGSIPVALVLGIQTIDMPYKELITYITFGVVFFSLVVQGLTMAPLIRMLKIIKVDKDQVKAERTLAEKAAIKKALSELKKIHDDGEISEMVYESAVKEYKEKLAKLKEVHVNHLQTRKALLKKQEDYVKKKGLIAEKSAIHDQLQKGLLTEEAGNELLAEIDTKLDLLEK